jgi:hypothetical protein
VDAEPAASGTPQRAFPTEIEPLLARAGAYIESKGGLAGLRQRYGIDKTFVVPIMTNLALAGLVEWREIDPLPFELACVPQSWYRFVGMPVVSYAIPALVAIGQARYYHAPPRNPLTRLIRWLSITRSLRVLRQMQPDSGGYLEATPLTSFVVMSLASTPKPRPLVAVHNAQRGSAASDIHPNPYAQTESSTTASNSSPPRSARTAVGRSTRTSPPGTRRLPSTPSPARAKTSPCCWALAAPPTAL